METLTVQELIDHLKTVEDTYQFRQFVDRNFLDLYESYNYELPEKLKEDIAGLLYYSIFGPIKD